MRSVTHRISVVHKTSPPFWVFSQLVSQACTAHTSPWCTIKSGRLSLLPKKSLVGITPTLQALLSGLTNPRRPHNNDNTSLNQTAFFLCVPSVSTIISKMTSGMFIAFSGRSREFSDEAIIIGDILIWKIHRSVCQY